jgi:NADPH:quinone reductase-like Zn-dependent oxidoreductase
VNPIDWKVRAGYMKDYIPLPLPFIPGWDVSGVVEALGPGVTKFKKGDEVYSRPDVARDGYGGYAEYVVVKETETALKPKSIDHVHATTIPVAGVTAWRALFDTADLKQDQRVLIHGAAGGVGSFAVQLAKWKGAYVIGTASTGNQAFLLELGVDEPIDYTNTRFEDEASDVDVVLDTIGGETQTRSWIVLKKGGILVSIVGQPAVEEAAKHGLRAAFVSAHADSFLLAELARLTDSGKLKPIVETVLPLSEARRAHELNETRHARGKIVLKVA